MTSLRFAQRFPLAAAVDDTINIPPSIHCWMGQQDPHVQHPRPLDVPPCPAGTQVGPAVFVQRRRGGSRTAVDDGNVRFQWQRDIGSVGGDGDGR